MAADAPPIPPALWLRIITFLQHKATGQVVLHVHRGRVNSVSLNEQVRDEQTERDRPNTN